MLVVSAGDTGMGNSHKKASPSECLHDLISANDVNGVRTFLTKHLAAQTSRANDRQTQAMRCMDLNAVLTDKTLSPLHMACKLSYAAMARVIMDTPGTDPATGMPRVDPNSLGAYHNTALHHACSTPASAQVVADLLVRRADPFVVSMQGATALDIARKSGDASCVRTLEDKVKLWQGWVDHYERRVIVPRWSPKWLVIHLDRRCNSGSGVAQLTACSVCHTQQPTPRLVSSFQCSSCHTEIQVLPTLQLAIYEPRRAQSKVQSTLILPDTSMPSATQVLPQLAEGMLVRALEDPSSSTALDALFRGSWKRAMQNTVGSQRSHGLSCKILAADKNTVLNEFSFRVANEEDRAALLSIFQNPITASSSKVRGMWEASASSNAQVLRTAQASSSSRPSGSSSSASASGLPVAQARLVAVAGVHQSSQAAVTVTARVVASPAQPASSSSSQTAPSPPPPPPPPPPQSTCASTTWDPTVDPLPSVDPGASSASPRLPEKTPNSEVDTTDTSEASGDVGTCVVCLEGPADTAVVPCGHMCGCHDCLDLIKNSSSALCPMCRGPLTSIIRIFRS